MPFVYLLYPDATSWCVRLDEVEVARLPTFEAAERRARWLTTRQAVRGHASELHVLDAEGALTGRWIGERYLACARPRAALAA